MELKHIVRLGRRWIGYVALRFCSLIIHLIPAPSIKPIAKITSEIGYILAGRHRKIALNTLNLAFGNSIERRQKVKIAKDSFRFMASGVLELLFCVEYHNYIKKIVNIEGRDNLDKALAKKKGVISVTAHFGNFALMQFGLAAEGYSVNSIIRHMRDPQTDRYFLKKRNEIGVKTIYTEPRKICVTESLRSLKNNEVLFFLLDQNFGTGGVFVDFFCRKAATATGPIVLAQRSNAAILPMFMVHDQKETHRLIIEPEFKLEECADNNQTILLNIQRLTNIIECYIRRYPAEWSWIHRRWKSRPQDK